MSDWRERSADEREAARRERERRRASRSAGPARPATGPGQDEPAEAVEPPVPGSDGHDGEFANAGLYELDHDHDDHNFDDPDNGNEHDADDHDDADDHHPHDDHDPDDDHDADDDHDPHDDHDPDDDHDGDDHEYDDPELDGTEHPSTEHEVASGTRRVSRTAQLRAAKRDARAGGGDHTPRPARGAKGRHSRIGRVISLLALVVAAALIWFLVELFQPFHGAGHGSVKVTIPPGSSSKQVGNLLAQDGVISSGFFFELRATLAGERGSLRSGTYHLQQDMSYGDVLKILTTAPPPVPTTQLTIAEGHTRRQIAALLRAQGIHGNYVAATRHSKLLNPRSYGAPADTPSLEGFLFPDTYQLVKPVKINALINDQLGTFKQKWRNVNLSYARSQHLSPYDVLIIASMIEGEAQTTHDLALVSSVIYNRLRTDMPLGMDSTIRYSTGNYSTPLTSSQLSTPGPYNTRLNKGLPPTPINNPGLAQIEAAAHPARTNYVFFITKACGNGSLAFATTYQQFLVLDQQYNAARAKQGGRSPTHC